MNTSRKQLQKIKRVVVKVGTSQLADLKHGVKEAMLVKLTAEVQGLRRQGRQVVIVTSGAIGLGMHQLGLTAHRDLPIVPSCDDVRQEVAVDIVCFLP